MRSSRYALAAAVLVLALAILISASPTHGDALRVSGDVVRVVIEFSDGSTRVFEAQQPTATPSATATPPPTNTPRPTDTPDVEPTPTPEVIPATPGPTAEPVACALKVGQYNMRLRSAPVTGTLANIVGSVPANTVQDVGQFEQANGYLWAVSAGGYWAVYEIGTGTWFVYGVSDQSEACQDVPGWVDGLEPPAPIVSPAPVYVGFKATPGASADVLIDFARQLPDAYEAVMFVVQETELATRLHQSGIYVVFVPWSQFPGDCANVSMSPTNSAANRLRYVEQQAGAATFDAVVLTNECHWPDAEYYAAWALAALDGCDARGWTCAPTVWNPGTPDLAWLPTLDAMHCEMQARGHLYGANIYPYWPVDLATRNADTAYTTWRHEIIKARMQCAPSWMVTELAPDGGGWPPDVPGTAAYIKTTAGAIAFFGVWYYSGDNRLPAWPDAAWSAADVRALLEYL